MLKSGGFFFPPRPVSRYSVASIFPGMDGLTSHRFGRHLFLPPPTAIIRPPVPRTSLVMVKCSSPSAGDSPAESINLNEWDKMELQFGRLLGEDPKLTLAKILARKSNPDVSYMEVEKAYNKGKLKELIPDNISGIELGTRPQRRPAVPARSLKVDNITLARPVMRKDSNTKSRVQMTVPPKRVQAEPTEKGDANSPTMIAYLRSPSKPKPLASEINQSLRVQVKPNLSFDLKKENTIEDVDALLRKPEKLSLAIRPVEDEVHSKASKKDLFANPTQSNVDVEETSLKGGNELDPDVNLAVNLGMRYLGGIQKDGTDLQTDSLGRTLSGNAGSVEEYLNNQNGPLESFEKSDEFQAEVQSPKQFADDSFHVNDEVTQLLGASSDIKLDLMEKPQRIDTSSANSNTLDKCSASASNKEYEVEDWARAELLFQTGELEEVQLISCNKRGFMVSFGSLVGFLPYQRLRTRWKFVAFESWLTQMGLDPSTFGQSTSFKDNLKLDDNSQMDVEPDTVQSLETMSISRLSPNMELKHLLEVYDEEKTRHLASFVGQRMKVIVFHVERKSRKLVFSGKFKESEEMAERKKILMEKLRIGDVVEGRITKITYFGVFVEVEGVPALVHQSEVSWDETLDLSMFFKIGQIVKAKVHRLDFALARIGLSMKQVAPDPLMETLESMNEGNSSRSGEVEALQADAEWPDVEQLIEELKKVDGIENVSKGRFLLSPGLAPAFQVYMAPMVDNQYKLLARFENKVQEVLVQSSLDMELMKSAVVSCTRNVE